MSKNTFLNCELNLHMCRAVLTQQVHIKETDFAYNCDWASVLAYFLGYIMTRSDSCSKIPFHTAHLEHGKPDKSVNQRLKLKNETDILVYKF